MNADDARSARLDQLRTEQVASWERGERATVEQLVATDADLAADPDCLLDLIYSELLLREEAGEHPTADEFAVRFPQLADAIRRQFAVHAALPLDDSWLPPSSSLVTRRSAVSSSSDSAARSPSDALTATPASNALPTVPDYDVLREVGRGGMGVVYEARHRQLKRAVALKMIRDRALADASLLERFRAEAEAVARLEHPNIVKIYDCGEVDGVPFLSLEFVAGGSLESWTRPPLHPIRQCAALVEVVARAVGYAHTQKIIHRDLKPANILLAPISSTVSSNDSHGGSNSGQPLTLEPLDVRPKITDFGLAKQFTSDSNLTHSEAILGTTAYMSPEQAWGHSRDVGPWTDVHALGAILYELLTGQTPFHDESMIKILDRVRFREAEPPSRLRVDVPAPLDAICLRCLRKTPADRYATADQLADDLQRFLKNESLDDTTRAVAASKTAASRTKWSVIAGSLVLLALVAGLVWFSPRGQRPAQENSNGSSADVTETPPRTTPESFAFLVGVRSYQFGDSRLDLDYTEADVDELSRVLLKQGYSRQNIRLLTQWSEADNPGLAPTADNIRRQLRTLLKTCIPGDTVLVAITGMGGESGSEATYCYLPSRAKLDAPETLIGLPEFYQLFRDCPAEQKILLVDTCQTASLPDYGWTATTPPPGTAALFACSRHEASYEHASLRHGVFSYHVMRGLEGAADANHDGRVALEELAEFTKSGVQQFVKKNLSDATQTPMLQSALDLSTPLVPVGAPLPRFASP